MKSIVSLGVIALTLGFTACENPTVTNATRIANRDAESKGSPFRWKSESASGGTVMYQVMVDLPSGPTKADPALKQDTLALIARAEASKGRSNPEVVDIKLLKDGREVWILKAGDGLAYIVDFVPSPQGGTDINLNGPHEYRIDASK